MIAIPDKVRTRIVGARLTPRRTEAGNDRGEGCQLLARSREHLISPRVAPGRSLSHSASGFSVSTAQARVPA